MLWNINNQQIQIHDRVDCKSNTSSKTLSHTLLRLKKQSQFTAKSYLPSLCYHPPPVIICGSSNFSISRRESDSPTNDSHTIHSIQSTIGFACGFRVLEIKEITFFHPPPPYTPPPYGTGTEHLSLSPVSNHLYPLSPPF